MLLKNPRPPGDIARLGTRIYECDLRSKLEREHIGKYVVIDVDSGEYELDSDHLAALNRATAKRENAVLFTIRVGYPTGGRIGARLRAANP